MSEVQYSAPANLADAVALLAGGGSPAVLAGGTDLLVQLRGGRPEPSAFIDIKRIPELTAIRMAGDVVSIGAAVPAAQITEHPELGAVFPGVVEALGLIGSTQIQGRATPGGNLCNASPAADSVPAMVASGAICRVAGPAGERRIPVEQFVTGPGKTVLRAGEFLVCLELPRPAAGTADAYLRFIPRTEMDIAVAGAAVSLTLDAGGVCTAARVAIGAVAPTVLLVPDAADALIGSRLEDNALNEAGAAASAIARPIDDKRGTVAYRKAVVGVLTRRAAKIAYQRAQGGAA
ncbi:MAG: xanthine dehydrogenase family protein subunit M [Pseudomonadota bacterium]|nr:xanthine dehydrogenase family protein subunit M [Pseudomonadota bacterium]